MAKDLEREDLEAGHSAETFGELKSKIKSSAKAKKEVEATPIVRLKREVETVVEEVEPVEEVEVVEAEKVAEPKKEVKYVQSEFLKQLLDPENNDNIDFYDEDGNLLSFEQIAIIPHNEKVYVILKPVDEMEGVGEDEALVFVVDFDDNILQDYLKLVEDPVDIEIIFEKYYDLLRDAGVKVDGEDGYNI